jgi:hypothetical protein
MDRTPNVRLGILLRRTGVVLFWLAGLWWFLGPHIVGRFVTGDRIRAGAPTLLIEGAVVLIGVLSYSLGKYTFAH